MARTSLFLETPVRGIKFSSSDDEDEEVNLNGYAPQLNGGINTRTNYFNIVVIGLTAILTACFAIYLYYWFFGEVNWRLADDTSISFDDYSLLSAFFRVFYAFLWSSGLGLAMGLYTFMIIFLDSAVPGVSPPTPFSPRSLRESSGHRFHTGYLMAFLNGFFVFAYSLWGQFRANTVSSDGNS